MTIAEAADRFGISQRIIRAYIKAGHLKAEKQPPGPWPGYVFPDDQEPVLRNIARFVGMRGAVSYYDPAEDYTRWRSIVELSEYLGIHPTTIKYHIHQNGLAIGAWIASNRRAYPPTQQETYDALRHAKAPAAPAAQWAVEQAEATLRSILNPRAFRCGAITIGTEGKVYVQFTAVSTGEGTADITATFNTSLITIEPVSFTMPTKAGNGCGNGHFGKEVNRAIDQVKLRAGLAGQIIM